MYYPFFRGKQYELVCIRENAELILKSNFTPIIEPVKDSLSGLRKTIDALNAVSANSILIVNPQYGDHSVNPTKIENFISELPKDVGVHIGIIVGEGAGIRRIKSLTKKYESRNIALIHAGYAGGEELADHSQSLEGEVKHIFLEDYCGKLYRRYFTNQTRVLVKDGFRKRRNRDYPGDEYFADLHITFENENMDGFGDFLIVGDDYSENGGPAYAIAIHISYVEPNASDEMRIFHFLSDRQNTPTDPAGKFAESLAKLVAEATRRDSKLFHGTAIENFIDLHRTKHYPGLGYVKKLSMQHHMEVIANYLN